MVSSALDMGLQDLLETLERFRRDYADDPEYRRLRADLPIDWPM
jgi:hypothetical protein